MRLLLGLLVLGGLCLLAANWQENLRSAALETRRLERGIPSHAVPEVNGTDGWATLVLGTPSGAEPIAPQVSPKNPPVIQIPIRGVAIPANAPTVSSPPTLQADQEHTVVKGDSLSRICEKHYGTSRSSVIKALARYNGLGSANQIQLGATLLLPDLDLLLED